MRPAVRLVLGLLVVVAGMGCAVEEAGIDPPDGAKRRFHFPSGLALDPTGTWLYVTNANADLLYNHGTLQRVSVAGDPPECQTDPVGPAFENCEETGPDASLIEEQLKIGSFAGDIQIDRTGARLYFTTRSGPSSVVGVDLHSGALPDEGDDTSMHVVEALADSGGQELPAEPFGVELLDSCVPARLLVTHLTSGVVSLLHDCGDDGLKLAATSPPLLTPSGGNPQRAFAVAARQPDQCGGPAYVTSSTSTQVAVVVPDDPGSCDPCAAGAGSGAEACVPRLVTAPTFSLAPPLDNEVRGTGTDGSDSRGIAFDTDGSRAWISVREPPALLRVDTREDESGFFRNRVDAYTEVCPQPSAVKVRRSADVSAGRPMVYVVCFATHQIFVVDGDLMELVDVIETGRGPASLEFDETNRRAFLANYAENTIGVIDLDPTSATFHRMVRTLGLPEPLLE